MDFVKREDQSIIDDEHYKVYMENLQKSHQIDTSDYQQAISMEQLHQAMQSSLSASTLVHNFQLPLSPRQISSLMLKSNHFNRFNEIPAHLARNLEMDLVQNLTNDLPQNLRHEDLLNQNLNRLDNLARLNELELHNGLPQNIQINEELRINDLPQNLAREMDLNHEMILPHLARNMEVEMLSDDRRIMGEEPLVDQRLVVNALDVSESQRQMDDHLIPMPFHIKSEQEDDGYFYENNINQSIPNVNGLNGHIPSHTEPPQSSIHHEMYTVYNNHISNLPALNPLDLYSRPQNYIQNYVTNIRENPENLVIHRQYENTSPYTDELKKIRQDGNQTSGKSDIKIEQPKENLKPTDQNKIFFPNFQNGHGHYIDSEKNENDSNVHNKITEDLSMNIKGEYSCYKCNDVFSSKRGLKQHTKTCIETEENEALEKLGKFSCTQCAYRCQSPAILKIHERTHTGEKPFSCTFCDYKSGQKNNVAKHILVHMKEKPFRCQYCDYRCAQKNNLVVHERTHTGYKPFACPYCEYRTVQKPNLVKHMYLHTDQKPFSCDQCSYRCVQKTNLTKHKQRHLNEKGEKLDLKNQTKPYRPRQKSVKCPHCPYKCVQKSSLDKHMQFKHGDVQNLELPQDYEGLNLMKSDCESIQNLSVKKDQFSECQEKESLEVQS